MNVNALPTKQIKFLLSELDYDIDNAQMKVAKAKTVLEANRNRARLTSYEGFKKRLERALDEKQKK